LTKSPSQRGFEGCSETENNKRSWFYREILIILTPSPFPIIIFIS
jgi:hypothetical protein